MRFHLIDRVDSFEPARSVRARKLTSYSEDYWEDLDGVPVMPPPFLLEAFCQAGTWLIIASTERRKRAALLSVGSVAFLEEVHPGDVLEIEGSADTWSEETAVLSGRVVVDGRPVLEAKEIMCVLIDASDLEDLEATARMQELLIKSGGT